jgi:methyl-accepting chemotaxis protein
MNQPQPSWIARLLNLGPPPPTPGLRQAEEQARRDEQAALADMKGQLAAIRKAQALIEFSLESRSLFANDNFLQTLGHSLAEMQGQHHSLFAEPADRASAPYRLFWEQLGRGEFDAGPYRRIGKGGNEVCWPTCRRVARSAPTGPSWAPTSSSSATC